MPKPPWFVCKEAERVNRHTVSLAPCGAYGFGLVLAYLRTSPSAIVERLHEHGFQRALDIGPGVVVKVVRENLYPCEDPLTLTIWGETLTPSLVEVVVANMRRMLVLDSEGPWAKDILAHGIRHSAPMCSGIVDFAPFSSARPGKPCSGP